MSKQYTRKRTNKPFTHTFECKRCGKVCDSKKEFKEHYRATADHDQRVRI